MSSTDTRALSRPTSLAARLDAAGLPPPFFLSASLHGLRREELFWCPAGRQPTGGSNLRRILLIVFGLSAALPSGVALADSDAKRGAQIYRSCVACHALELGLNLTGSNLGNVWDRPAGRAGGFDRYSDALRDVGFPWDAVALDAWLENPQGMIEGTSMAFPGIADAGQRADLIAFLEQAGGPGEAERLAARGVNPTAYLREPTHQPIGDAPDHARVTAVWHCGDGYTIETADGASAVLWEKNVRLKIDSTETGPPPGVGVVLGAGMQSDRYSVIFSSVADLQRLVSETCKAR